ncbi:hypothetical protein RND81_07G024500 [Saponaria officinalis]|uniref:Uncharacterized protein n=1 Tax=Saponaria officinalis TaxID=3572 RepID=A0AAW1JK08_SAPOF
MARGAEIRSFKIKVKCPLASYTRTALAWWSPGAKIRRKTQTDANWRPTGDPVATHWRVAGEQVANGTRPRWELCHVIYNGLNKETLEHVHSLSEGKFINGLSYEEKWELFEYLAHDTEEWERYNSLPIQPQPFYSDAFNCHDNSSMSSEDMIRALATDTIIMQNDVVPPQCNPSKSTEDMIRALMADVNLFCANVTPSPCETNLVSQDLEDRVEQVTSHFDTCVTQEELDSYYIKWQAEQVDKCHDPLPLEPEMNHSYKECDVDSDDDGFWDDEEDEYGVIHSSPSSPVSMLVYSSCTNIEMTHVDNSLMQSDLSNFSIVDDFSNVIVEHEKEGVFVSCDETIMSGVEEEEILVFNTMKDDLPTLGEFISMKFDKKVGEGEDNLVSEFYIHKEEPPIPPFQTQYVLIPQKFYSIPIPCLTIPISTSSYNEPYRETVANSEKHRGKEKYLHVYTSFVHVWFQLLLRYYCHFSFLWANTFDRLLRALSCSACDLTFHSFSMVHWCASSVFRGCRYDLGTDVGSPVLVAMGILLIRMVGLQTSHTEHSVTLHPVWSLELVHNSSNPLNYLERAFIFSHSLLSLPPQES